MSATFLFTNANNASIASTETLVRTTGYSVNGKGQADYVYDSSLTQTDANNNPRTIFTAADGRRFRLAETVRTPAMFGCTGATDGSDTVPLQAFFNDALPAANAAANSYDFSGTWTVDGPLYAAYPSDTICRRFVCGKITVVPLSALGGTPIDAVLTVAGTWQHWSGHLDIRHASIDPHYDDRAFRNGLRFVEAGNSTFGTINVTGARRNGIDFFVYAGTPIVFQAGTPSEVTKSTSNNIGIKIERVKGWYSGSYRNSANMAHIQTISAVSHGGGNAFTQYSDLTVASTAELRKLDYGTAALERGTATYTSIAADNATSSITWTAGDPAAEGFAVGDTVVMTGGSNASIEFEVLSFGGTSNRTMTVRPAPVTQAATVNVTRFATKDTWHLITDVLSSTSIRVFPRLDSRVGSGTVFRSAHGFVVDVLGADTASLEIGSIDGLVCAGGLRSAGLYGAVCQNLQVDYANIGLVIGSLPSSASIGHAVDHCHLEATDADIIFVPLTEARCVIKAPSAISIVGGAVTQDPFQRIVKLNPRSPFTNKIDDTGTILGLSLLIGGDRYDGMATNAYSQISHNDYYLSNQPKLRDQHIATNGSNVNLSWYDSIARRMGGHHRARLLWTGPTGAAPTGTLTFKRDSAMTAAGWKIMGTAADYALANGGANAAVELVFDNATKNVILVRFPAA
jgi:hypothetical protein